MNYRDRQALDRYITGNWGEDQFDDDLDQDNPVDMNADDWAEFYDDCEDRTGMSFEEYLDNDHSMDF